MSRVPAVCRLVLNGETFAEPEAGLCFMPGRSNTLEIDPDWERLDGDTLHVTVRKVLPDGSAEERDAVIHARGKHALELGPMTAPALYEFEAGVVYRRGYRLEVRLNDASGKGSIESLSFHQGLSATVAEGIDLRGKHRQGQYCKGMRLPAGPERLVPGNEERLVYNPLYGIESALGLRLSDEVLRDPNAVRVMARLNPGACVEHLECRLVVTAADGKRLTEDTIELGPPGGEWASQSPVVDDWPEGDYDIALYPLVAGREWREGPRVVYRRRKTDPGVAPISPFTPWTLQRDRTREEIEVTDFKAACRQWSDGVPAGWVFERGTDGVALACPTDTEAGPVRLRLPLHGWYAVYIQAHASGCLLQAGEQDLVRWCGGVPIDPAVMHSASDRPADPASASGAPVFTMAGDLSGAVIKVFPFEAYCNVASGLRCLKLVPVTQASVEDFYDATSNPPAPLYGVNDWGSYFVGPTRLAQDQLDAVVGGQTELGMRTLDWQVGRSTVEYDSELPNVTIFAADLCVDDASDDLKKQMEAWGLLGMATMTNKYEPLRSALDSRERFGCRVWGWLCMNRHYGPEFVGGVYTSKFFCDNPQWWRRTRDGAPPNLSWGGVCYFFPQVRQERIDIFLEVARKGADGLLVGCCRQVPMMLYNPDMVAAYEERTGIDPRKIDDSQEDEYHRWIKWRAGHFTQLLRDLKAGVDAIRAQSGRAIPLAVRIPSAGLSYNLAQGLDVEAWLDEGLVDQLQLDPLETSGGRGSHDIRPYVELGRRYGIPVLGGIGCTWEWTPEGYVPAMRRALGLLDTGVDGIEIYETEILAKSSLARWIVPLFGNAMKTRAFLADSNLEACYPISASNAMFGYDIHSKWLPQPRHDL